MTVQNTGKLTPGAVIKNLQIGSFVTVKKIEQGGALQARRLADDSVQLYWRYTLAGKTDRVAIGAYDPTAPPKSLKRTDRGYSIAAASEACAAKAGINRDLAVQGGYREHVAKVTRTFDATVVKRNDEKKQTLERMLNAYCDHLESSGRRSHADARSMFRLHVMAAWPKLAGSPAVSIQAADITDMLRKLQEADKGRTANKLRAYIRAAYQCALDVNSLASIPTVFKTFQITSNPAALTKRDAKHDKADKNPLSATELRAYWNLIKTAPGIKGAALRLHLLSGGQRVEQISKLKKRDVSEASFTIYDNKGRPGQGPRRHTRPMTPQIKAAISELKSDGEFVLSNNKGKTPVSAMTLSNWSQELATGIDGFQLKRVRSGVETALASKQVSKDIRGQLQSHGLSGVQARHYDDHDYLPEKRAALETLFELLQAAPT